MQGPLRHRVAAAISAIALLVLVVSVPSAAAQSLFQGAVQPAPSGSPQPAFQQPAPSPSPVLPPRPDVKVTSLGVVHSVGGNDVYAFRVKNVGQASASELKITKQAVIKRKSDKTWVRTEVNTSSHDSPLKPGQEMVVEVPCPATQRQYCDVGGLLAEVVGTPEDADPTNNHAPVFDNIKGD